MKKAAQSAAKWLMEHSRSKDIPYAFFEPIVRQQIFWKNEKGIILDFNELAAATKKILHKSGYSVMPKDSSPKRKDNTANENLSSFGIAPDEAQAMSELFGWLQEVLAKGAGCSEIVFSANFKND